MPLRRRGCREYWLDADMTVAGRASVRLLHPTMQGRARLEDEFPGVQLRSGRDLELPEEVRHQAFGTESDVECAGGQLAVPCCFLDRAVHFSAKLTRCSSCSDDFDSRGERFRHGLPAR